MSPQDLGGLTLVLLGAALVAGVAGWSRAGRQVWAPAAVVLLAAAALVAAAPARVDLDGRDLVTVLVVLAGLLAVVGGGPVTSRVFELVDGQERTATVVTLDSAGSVLRGGAWIGALERAAVFASLAAGLPEGVAIVLAVKGLGRYPELRNQEVTGAAERFIIGTFTSVLWAAACAGVVRLLV
jgi:hypothetical protein